MLAAILSDTHNLLRPEVLETLQGADVILHGGDISSRKILDQLEEIAPVYAVRGNNDKEWAESLPHHLQLELEGVRIYMVHKKGEVPPEPEADVIVYGHSHKYSQEEREGVLWLNPGSCGPRRFHQEITLALARLEGGRCRVQKITVPHPETGRKEES